MFATVRARVSVSDTQVCTVLYSVVYVVLDKKKMSAFNESATAHATCLYRYPVPGT